MHPLTSRHTQLGASALEEECSPSEEVQHHSTSPSIHTSNINKHLPTDMKNLYSLLMQVGVWEPQANISLFVCFY